MERKKNKKTTKGFFLTNSVALTQKVGMRNVSDEGFGAEGLSQAKANKAAFTLMCHLIATGPGGGY